MPWVSPQGSHSNSIEDPEVSELLNFGIDAFADAALNLIDGQAGSVKNVILFNAATVNIPEPGAAALLGFGLLGLVLLRRRAP